MKNRINFGVGVVSVILCAQIVLLIVISYANKDFVLAGLAAGFIAFTAAGLGNVKAIVLDNGLQKRDWDKRETR